ncbi:hypothetical protein [Polymorphum gilvum]|uniref:Transmembrane protein n=1 Tax=Polymorphum gilvum (strain LMG 25793 / CGMCC 1.9160 / SL003B-26A1) TaxID=991905 RepID=F2IWK4_POLGS|nr:hypothetical protein [Polymorphum gilvum]ADZ70329.1 hypothetical protein SL003B_1903 [Polymorphum gilvum SL003B-26A1]
MSGLDRPIDVEKALLDAASQFSCPEDVVKSASLRSEQKIEILRRWAYDVAEAAVATEEGMPGGNGDLHGRILTALDSLTDGVDLERVAPTKQHGLPRSAIRVGETVAYQTRTEVVGLFHSAERLEQAVDDLLSNGFDRADLSILASEAAVAEKFAGKVVSVREIEDRPDVPTMAYVSTESVGDAEGAILGGFIYIPAMIGAAAVVATGGTLAAAIAAVAIASGIGAGFGALLAGMLGDAHAATIEQHLQRGGLLLWVRARDGAHEERAAGILRAAGAEDIHSHALPALV